LLVIPAIDLRGGKVVRLFQGDYEKTKVYGKDPLSYALHFQKAGAKRIHIVDLDGAKEGWPVHQKLILSLIKELKVPVQVGGGIREEKHLESYLEGGVSQVILGTKAVEDPKWLKEITEKYPGRIIVSVDVKGETVALSGWLRTSKLNYLDFLKSLERFKLFAVILTLIERDGTQQGIETERLEKALSVSPHPLILAGGVSTIEDIKALKDYESAGLLGVISGRAIYEGTLDLQEAFRLAHGS